MATTSAQRAEARSVFPTSVIYDALFGTSVTTITQTYSTADATFSAYTADAESSAYTAVAAAADPAALTSAQLTGGESPTEAEHNALQVDVGVIRTALIATNTKTALAAKETDLNALRVAYENLRAHAEDIGKLVNSVVDALQAKGLLG